MGVRILPKPAAYATWLVAVLAGCSYSSVSPTAPLTQGASTEWSVRANLKRSWMSSAAKKNDLLYISNGNNEVDIYSYPSGAKVGLLSGFEGVNFMCVNKAGDIFIPNQGLNEIFEYAHGGTSPIATLNDPYGEANACSVDPLTGDLAVANLYTIGGSGNVAVYRHASGVPEVYNDSNFHLCEFVAYDGHSDLFLEGYSEIGYFEFAELPAERARFRTVTLDNYGLENGLQWEGTYLAVGGATDSGDTYIYHIKIQARTGTTIGTTAVDEIYPTANFFIKGTRIIVAGGEPSSDTRFFPYPAGGSPTKTISQDFSVGVVVSRGTK
ncbi:MAG TPA: hypothetical protein VIW73_00820 [Candidatus Cybelea sp.]